MIKFVKQEIVDRVSTTDNQFTIESIGGGLSKLTPNRSGVQVQGTRINKELLQRYENALHELLGQDFDTSKEYTIKIKNGNVEWNESGEIELYTNNDTTLPFPAQTITLEHNFNEFDYIVIIYKDNVNQADYVSEEIKIIKSTSLDMQTNEAVIMTQWNLYQRRAFFSNQGNTIRFDSAWRKALAEQGASVVDNEHFIPYKIIGIK